jgi:hypothetical protein
MQKRLLLDSCRRAFLTAGGVLALNSALQTRPSFSQTNSNGKLRIGVIGSSRIGVVAYGSKPGIRLYFLRAIPKNSKTW